MESPIGSLDKRVKNIASLDGTKVFESFSIFKN
jgi:hypothetical protein